MGIGELMSWRQDASHADTLASNNGLLISWQRDTKLTDNKLIMVNYVEILWG